MKKILLCLLISLGLSACSQNNSKDKENSERNEEETVEEVSDNTDSNNENLAASEEEKRNLLQNTLDQINSSHSTNFQIKDLELIVSLAGNFKATITYETPYDYTAEYNVLYSGQTLSCVSIETISVSPNYDYLLQEKYPKEIDDLLILAEGTGLVPQDLTTDINSFFIDSGNKKESVIKNLDNLKLSFLDYGYMSYSGNTQYNLSISTDY